MVDPMTVTSAPCKHANSPALRRGLSASLLVVLLGTTGLTPAQAQVPGAPAAQPPTAAPAPPPAPVQPGPPAAPAAPPTVSLSGAGTLFVNRILVRGNERIDPSTVLLDTGNFVVTDGTARTLLVTDALGGGVPTTLSILSDTN